jgi:hypothetical protein
VARLASGGRCAAIVAIVDAEDPGVARAEVWRILLQLGALDEPLRLNEERPGAPPGADPGEVEAAAGALLGYYLGGRRTDDELLGEVEAAWAGIRGAHRAAA